MFVSKFLQIRTSYQRGPDVHLTCPKCAQTARCTSLEVVETGLVLFLLPVCRLENLFLTCTACRAELIAYCDLSSLTTFSPHELSERVSVRVPLVSYVTAITSLAICWLPGWGRIFALLLWPINKRGFGWPQQIGRTSIIIGGVVVPITFIAVGILLIIARMFGFEV